MKSNGVLIVLEGIDGTGKSTQARRLAAHLEGKGLSTLLTQEPTDGPAGVEIRKIIQSGRHGISPEEEYRLFVQDRREHVEQVLKPALREGKVVILDRYYFSTMAYQGALGIDTGRILRENEAFAPRPDLLIVLDLTPEEAVSRIEKKRGELPNNFEGTEYLSRVRSIFQTLKGPRVIHVPADLPEDELFGLILGAVSETVGPLLNHCAKL
jgi:dTMP kinase